MRITIKEYDLPILKELSYTLTSFFKEEYQQNKTYFENSRHETLSVARELNKLPKQELEETVSDSPALIKLIRKGGGITADFIHNSILNSIPQHPGTASIQVAIAKSLGYKNWGDLQAKAKFSHKEARSELENLFTDSIKVEFIDNLIKELKLEESLTDKKDLGNEIVRLLQGTCVPTRIHFSLTGSCVAIGNTQEVDRVLSLRMNAIKQAKGKAVILASAKRVKSIMDQGIISSEDTVIGWHPRLSVDVFLKEQSNENTLVIAADPEKVINSFKVLMDVGKSGFSLESEGKKFLLYEPGHPRRYHFLIPEGDGMMDNQYIYRSYAMSRSLGASMFLGVNLFSHPTYSILPSLIANSFDVVCGPCLSVSAAKLMNIYDWDGIDFYHSSINEPRQRVCKLDD